MKQLINDLEISFSQKGEGPPVVLLHGLAEDKNSFAQVQEGLAGYRTYALDLRGHGESALGEPSGTLGQLAADLCGFLEAVSGPAQCIGYSLGGTIVLKAALQRPELIRHAIVVGTSTVVGSAAVELFQQRLQLIMSDFAAFSDALGSDTAAQIVSPDVDHSTVAKRRLAAIGDGRGYVNAAQAIIGMHNDKLTPLLDRIQCRTTVIGMDQDVFCPRKAADIMLEHLPVAHYVEIGEAGHLVSIDQPESYIDTLKHALRTGESV